MPQNFPLSLRQASSFIGEVHFKDLAKEIQDDITTFIQPEEDAILLHYVVVPEELKLKADPANLATAMEHAKEYLNGKDLEKEKGDLIGKDKAILIQNDKVVDGHHHLAKALELGVTSALKCIDMTPHKYQKKVASGNLPTGWLLADGMFLPVGHHAYGVVRNPTDFGTSETAPEVQQAKKLLDDGMGLGEAYTIAYRVGAIRMRGDHNDGRFIGSGVQDPTSSQKRTLEDFYFKHEKRIPVVLEKLSLPDFRQTKVTVLFDAELYGPDGGQRTAQQKQLNPQLWDNHGTEPHLHPAIKGKLLTIAKAFNKEIGLNVEPTDIILTGSNANYNYHHGSDIDLHLVYDPQHIPQGTTEHGDVSTLLRELLSSKKAFWNKEHHIKVGDSDVELYGQLTTEPHYSSGVYSVKDSKWEVQPRQMEPLDQHTQQIIQTKANCLARQIKHIISTGSLERIECIKGKIKAIRQSGLSQSGEQSIGNMVFKVLRDNGSLEALYDAQLKVQDTELSIKAMKLCVNVPHVERTLPLSKKVAGIPENFDPVANDADWVMEAGANDWEAGHSFARVTFKDGSYCWMDIKYDKENTQDADEETIKQQEEHGNKAVDVWISTAKGLKRDDESWYEAFASALESSDMSEYKERDGCYNAKVEGKGNVIANGLQKDQVQGEAEWPDVIGGGSWEPQKKNAIRQVDIETIRLGLVKKIAQFEGAPQAVVYVEPADRVVDNAVTSLIGAIFPPVKNIQWKVRKPDDKAALKMLAEMGTRFEVDSGDPNRFYLDGAARGINCRATAVHGKVMIDSLRVPVALQGTGAASAAVLMLQGLADANDAVIEFYNHPELAAGLSPAQQGKQTAILARKIIAQYDGAFRALAASEEADKNLWVGTVHHDGSVEGTKGVAGQISHGKLGLWQGERWRSLAGSGKVAWWFEPTPEQQHAVENFLAHKGETITQHVLMADPSGEGTNATETHAIRLSNKHEAQPFTTDAACFVRVGEQKPEPPTTTTTTQQGGTLWIKAQVEVTAAPAPIWDPIDGIGAVPLNRDVEYFGFVKQMTPAQFLSLVPVGVSNTSSKSFMMDAISKGTSLGNPFLQVKWQSEGNAWLVVNHEGRSRMSAVGEVAPSTLVPVHIFPVGMRSRDISDTMRDAPFLRQVNAEGKSVPSESTEVALEDQDAPDGDKELDPEPNIVPVRDGDTDHSVSVHAKPSQLMPENTKDQVDRSVVSQMNSGAVTDVDQDSPNASQATTDKKVPLSIKDTEDLEEDKGPYDMHQVAAKNPKCSVLKEHKVPLDEGEKEEAIKAGCTWHHGPNGESTCAIWKADYNGKIYYVANTHRMYQTAPTMKGIIAKWPAVKESA